MDKDQELVLEILNKLINRINQVGETTNANFENLIGKIDKINTKPTLVFNSKPIEESISKIINSNIQVWKIDVGEQIVKLKTVVEKSTNDYVALKTTENKSLTRKAKLRFWAAITSLLSILIVAILINFKQATRITQLMKNDMKYRYIQGVAKDNLKKQVMTLDSITQKLSIAEAKKKLFNTEGKK